MRQIGEAAWKRHFQKKKDYTRWFNENGYLLHVPQVLLGDEMNSVHFDWDKAFEEGALEDHFGVALIDVNASPSVSCSTALRIFYQEMHEYDPSWIVERFMCPVSPANEKLIKGSGFAYLSLEGGMPIKVFDVICCSQQMIGDEVNIIGMLQDAGIPVLSKDRTEDDPIIIRGGASSFSPSVIMDVCDLFFIGEGEGVLTELVAMIRDDLKKGMKREDILLEATQKWDCLWAPVFYEQRFDEKGDLTGMFPLRSDVPETIRYKYVPDLNNCFVLTNPIGNFAYPSNFTGGIEVTRGCEGQCSFCVSGHVYMPFRVRSVDCVVEKAREHLHNTGAEKVMISSFSGMSYPYLNTLARKINKEIGAPFVTMSLRLDSVNENPEFCAMLQRQGKNRIVFGVEGISQRLRQVTSKNCSEQQILDTVRALCHDGYRKIKFMFISGLPGENEKDRQELLDLTDKLKKIAAEYQKEDEDPVLFHYSWTPLKSFPFTPFQWLKADPELKLLPEEVRQKLLDKGVVITDKVSEDMQCEEILTQMLIRGDRRLQEMLIDMALAGIRRYEMFGTDAREFADKWLSQHEVPGYEYWFAAREKETVLPWDFIDAGIRKDHLWERYLSATGDDPKDFPRCLDRCQGCGACTPEHAKEMAQYRKDLKADHRISLRDIDPDNPEDTNTGKALRYAILTYTIDEMHRWVNRYYWANEVRKSLDFAGVSFQRVKVKVLKPYHERYDASSGIKTAIVGIYEDIPDEELIERLNEQSELIHFTGVSWVDHMPMMKSVSYRIPCPKGTDEAALSERIRDIMESDSWPIKLTIQKNCFERFVDADVRKQIMALELKDHSVCMTIDMALPLYSVYQSLLDIPWEVAGRNVAVCTGMEFE